MNYPAFPDLGLLLLGKKKIMFRVNKSLYNFKTPEIGIKNFGAFLIS